MGKSSTVAESKIHIISVSTYLFDFISYRDGIGIIEHYIKKKVIKYSDQVPIPIKSNGAIILIYKVVVSSHPTKFPNFRSSEGPRVAL